MRCRRQTARHITDSAGHCLLTVKANQPALRDKLKASPCKEVPATCPTGAGRGRRVRRTIKAIDAPSRIEFPAAAQIVQTRRTRTVKGRKHIEVVYEICSPPTAEAPPATIAARVQGHRGTENRLTGYATSCSTRTDTNCAPDTSRRSRRPSGTPRSACTDSPDKHASPQRHDITAAAGPLGAQLRGEDYPSVGGALASLCVDTAHSNRWWQYPQRADAAAAQAGHLGRFRTWAGLPCEFWQLRDPDAYTGPWQQSTQSPVLVIGTRYDPATPYRQAAPFARLFPRGRLLTLRGWGHTTLGQSTCIESDITRYLVHGVLPADGATCQPDAVPLSGPPPTARAAAPTPATPIAPWW